MEPLQSCLFLLACLLAMPAQLVAGVENIKERLLLSSQNRGRRSDTLHARVAALAGRLSAFQASPQQAIPGTPRTQPLLHMDSAGRLPVDRGLAALVMYYVVEPTSRKKGVMISGWAFRASNSAGCCESMCMASGVLRRITKIYLARFIFLFRNARGRLNLFFSLSSAELIVTDWAYGWHNGWSRSCCFARLCWRGAGSTM